MAAGGNKSLWTTRRIVRAPYLLRTIVAKDAMTHVLILGSGPNVVRCRDWPKAPFDLILAINNAWAVRPDWDVLIHPSDFPVDKHPKDLTPDQRIIRANDYVPVQNTLGGFVYAGGTMAFTAGYWALGALQPTTISMLGCDMVYDAKTTHFYGTGTADPLRPDISLRSLEAKAARLQILAAQRNCAVVNLSADPSRLTFPRTTPSAVAANLPVPHDATAAAAALAEEDRLGYYVPSGKYWKEEDRFDPDAIDALDQMWLKAALLA